MLLYRYRFWLALVGYFLFNLILQEIYASAWQGIEGLPKNLGGLEAQGDVPGLIGFLRSYEGTALNLFLFALSTILAIWLCCQRPLNTTIAIILVLVGTGFILCQRARILSFPLGAWAVISNTAKLCAAVSLAHLVLRAIRDRNLLVPVGIIASLVDILGVYLAYTAKMLKEKPEVVTSLSLHTPASAGIVGPLVVTMGPGDVLFLALFFSALYKFSLKTKPALWSSLAVVPAGLIAVLYFNISIPGLPLIAAVCLLPNWSNFQFSKQEKQAMLLALPFLIVLLLGFVLISRYLIR